MQRLATYLKSPVGAVALSFGLLVPVVVSAVGVSVDIGRSYLVKERLSHALDAAALAAATASQDDTIVKKKVQDFMAANYPAGSLGTVIDLKVTNTKASLKVDAKAQLDTSFMKIAGIDTVDVVETTTIQRVSRTNIELSMALDISGSMVGSKLTSLKEAANEMVDIIVSDNQSTVFSKIALVPYAVAVNVGSYANAVRGTVTSGTSTTPGSTNFKFNNYQNTSKTYAISNCVSERTGTNAYTDAPPSTALLGRNYPVSTNPCLTNQITPLTANRATLHTEINNLQASGSTGGHVGVAWGWYMLSKNFGYLFPKAENKPAAYNTENLTKILVLMTDGEYNSPYCKGVISDDATTGSGNRADHINCNSVNGTAYSQAEKLCTAMKAQGVVVYTVGFELIDSAAARSLMANCATDASHVYIADNEAELIQAFKDIAGDVLSVYISH